MQALDVQGAATFFGRDAHITRGLDELRRLRDGAPQRLLVTLGASGAGKSSFLRAGLIARLKGDCVSMNARHRISTTILASGAASACDVK